MVFWVYGRLSLCVQVMEEVVVEGRELAFLCCGGGFGEGKYWLFCFRFFLFDVVSILVAVSTFCGRRCFLLDVR